MQHQDYPPAYARFVLLLCLLYLTFVIYGSLVPLQFVHIPFDDALQRFSNIRYLQLKIHSRADWVANVLLMIPMAFLLAALLCKGGPLKYYPIRALLVWCFCAALAVGIEFTQLYFPQRTVSINDLIAEASGAALGLLLYALAGPKLLQFGRQLLLTNDANMLVRYLLLSYLLLFTAYQLMPLDLTLSPVELYKKWRENRVVLLPFSAYSGSAAQIGYAVLSDILLWCPLAILLWFDNRQNRGKRLLLQVTAMAAVIEILQLFVYSRVTDISDIIWAFVAASLCNNIIPRLPGSANRNLAAPPTTSHAVLLFFLLIGYSLLLMLAFWYPYNFNFDWGFINQRLAEANARVALESLYFGTEFRALTAVLQKVLLFMPLGLMLAVFYRLFTPGWPRRLCFMAIALYALMLTSGIEAVQIALPGKIADRTDVVLKLLGIIAGFAMYCHFAPILQRKTPVNAVAAQTQSIRFNQASNRRLPAWAFYAGHIVITLSALLLLSQVAALPYNVRELFASPIISTVCLSLAFYVAIAPALLFPQRFMAFFLLSFPVTLLQSLIVFVLLYNALPTEAIHDITGSPVTSLWPPLELALRFCGFMMLFLFQFQAAYCFSTDKQKAAHFILWCVASLFFSALWYWAVVIMAGTDNITELLRDSASYSAVLALSVWCMLVFLLAATSVQALKSVSIRRFSWLLLLLVITVPLSWWLINQATESVIVKYQQVFSALQFLLSSDRANYVSGTALFWRYLIALTGIWLLCCWLYLLAQSRQPFNAAGLAKPLTNVKQKS